ncbi:alpha-tocopherol transfer protein-like [Pseudomyrmex gracilis]|uniref:alpha-tocopherol transfer protein-like n=1 Tax=Pseudomyrmex gracilis TaxID=219809 RepID=UPI0009953129|nr:alpha-tocopherol transfer protein-like [Pseudomyrmex gracilis]XP_020286469.1 alpha-tocopherol transfer protein-like [Pseudomyrmex gracilis]
MCASAITEEKKEESDTPSMYEMYEDWLKNGPKLMFGEFPLLIDIYLNDSDDFFIQKAKDELRETPENVAESLKELRKLLAEESDLILPDDDSYYIMFLRCCKWYPKSAFSRMKRYFHFQQQYPHIYKDLLPSTAKLALCHGLLYALPFRTNDGCRILVAEAGKRWKPKEVSPNELFKGLILNLFVAMTEPKTQIAGGRAILDMDGLSLHHITYLTPSFAKMMVDFIQKCLPARLKSIHIVRQSFVFNIAFGLFKPFLEEKLRKRIFFHGTNFESLMTSMNTNKETLLKKHGGDLEMPEGPYGETYWRSVLYLEPFVKTKYGYVSDSSKT